MPREGLRDDDVVVIPAHNEEASIGTVVSYLLESGFNTQHLLVVNSHCTDQTVQTARDAARRHHGGENLRIIDPRTVLGEFKHEHTGACGIAECPGTLSPEGKGAAMYAATLTLTREHHPAESRVFFMDGDITNPLESDPIGSLLRAWERRPDAHIAKLASGKRENEGVIAFLNTLPFPYNQISNLAWPLCGQQSLHLGALQEIPFPSGYCVEVAFLAALVERFKGNFFVQEPIPRALAEERHPDDLERYTRMFTGIYFFLKKIVQQGGLSLMSPVDICKWNRGFWREVKDVGVPRVSPEHFERETIIVDSLLPPVNQLLAVAQ